MYRNVERTFYGLSAAALMAVLFIASPSNSPEVKQFQTSIAQQTKLAVHQIFGSMDPVSDLAFLWNGNQVFYSQSSSELLAVIPVIDEIPYPVQSNIDHLAFSATQALTLGINTVLGIQQPAVDTVAQAEGEILGVQTSGEAPASIPEPVEAAQSAVNPAASNHDAGQAAYKWTGEPAVNTQMHPWVTLQDNITGEAYCVAIYDGEVNKYPGACQYDYH